MPQDMNMPQAADQGAMGQDPFSTVAWPGSQGAAPEQPAEQPVSPEEQAQSDQYRADLQALLDGIEEKVNMHNSKMMEYGNEQETIKSDLLNQVFTQMVAAGVNLTDRDAINNYLLQMEQEDPNRYRLFVNLMSQILDEEDYPQEGEPTEAQGQPMEMQGQPMPDMSQMPSAQQPAMADMSQMPSMQQGQGQPLDLSQVPMEGQQ